MIGSYQEFLFHVLYETEEYKMSDLARLGRCTKETIRTASLGQTRLLSDTLLDVAEGLRVQHGDARLWQAILPDSCTMVCGAGGQADGNAADNLVRGTCALTDFYHAHDSGDLDAMRASLRAHIEEGKHLQAEIDRKARTMRSTT